MIWDYAETNPFAERRRFLDVLSRSLQRSLDKRGLTAADLLLQTRCSRLNDSRARPVSSLPIPPYYDNIGYADLSDFFYVWLRRSLKPVFPDLFATLAVPKAEELVATPYRHGGKEKAESILPRRHDAGDAPSCRAGAPAFPVTIYYAFKQSETDGDRRHCQHRLGDIPRCGDPRRLRDHRHLADAN